MPKKTDCAWLCNYNFGAESGRELFKGSASLLVCNRKKFFLGGCGLLWVKS